MLRTGQYNFSKGEISEELIARVEVSTYSAALRRARNVVILKYGGVSKRPGTRFIAEVFDQANASRLVPFQFSLTQTYALEMGQGYMRPLALGGVVLETKLTVQAVTLGATTTIRANYHAFNVGDQVYFNGVAGASGLNGKMGRVLAVIDANNFTVGIDSTTFGALTSDTGGIIRSAPPAAPPTPPVVPPVVPPPAEPATGAATVYTGLPGNLTYCVTDDTPILMAEGSERRAADLRAGDMVRTRHENTLEWGDYPIEAIEFEMAEVMVADGLPRATPCHLFYLGGWQRMETHGKPDGVARVAKITVKDAHTYVSAGVLSHNIKYLSLNR